MARPTVGFIGPGIMGGPMARNLLNAGYPLQVYSRTRSKAEPLLAEGAVLKESPAALAEGADVVMSIVSDSPDVESVYLGLHGVCKTLRAGSLCIDMSTISPETARQVAKAVKARGGAFLDAPVSGGKSGSEQGVLAVMVGGDPLDLDRARPLFDVVGKSVVHCGPVGHGQLTKLCNQILCGVNLLGVSEAIVFAKRVGLDPATMLEAVSGGAAGSWALENFGPRMLARDFAPRFTIDLQQKDLRIALQAASEHDAPVLGTALVAQLLAGNQAAGEGPEGVQALVKVVERLAGAR